VGTDNIDVAYCREKGIFVGRTVGSNARSVAETAISFVFADSKNLFESFSSTKEHGWAKLTGYEILGKTIGIVGFGMIGQQVAGMASALGMHVIAYDAYGIKKELADSLNVEIVDFETVVERSDFISLHIPLTAETKNMIFAKELTRMKPTAVLINTARGGVVNEADLYEALKNKTIKAAYFDVFSSEPPAKDEPLLTLPNFYLTPHIASRSAEAEKRTADMATEIIIKALSTDNE
jgi:phosphoglycerate dehydrogenase-like enzyme